MKIIKLHTPPDAIGVSDIDPEDKTKVYAVLFKNADKRVSVHCLLYTEKGYIFWDVKGRHGHSGYHPTIKEAIVKAFHVSSTEKIYQFDNMMEFSLWLAEIVIDFILIS